MNQTQTAPVQAPAPPRAGRETTSSFARLLLPSFGFLVALLLTSSAFAEANYVYHERTTSNPGCGGQYVDVLVPTSAQAVNIRFKVEYQNYTDRVRVYYTTDGSTPSGSFGTGSGTTLVIAATYNCTFGSPVVDVAAATIPAQPGGTTVKYIVSAWHSGGGAEIFANGPGTPCGCGTPTSSSALATVFSYTVQDTNPTWDGGASPDGNWSNGANWVLNGRPTSTGATLTFAGTTGLANTNDCVTALNTSGTALTFASGAGAFVLKGNAVTMGSGGGGGQTIIQQNSANNQEIAFNINLSGGNGDRSIVFGSGAGTLTLSGNINFGTTSGDWLFPTTVSSSPAGTIILSGNNTGDGKATVAITAGVNTMRAMMRNNVAGTQLVLGSDTALGNSGSGIVSAGTASFRGVLANQQLNISTTGGNRNLAGSTLAINANNITFNGANNLTVGNLIIQAGNRDFVVSSTGQVTVQDSLSLSADQTGRQLYVNLSGAGGLVVNGKVYDTFHSGGLTTPGSGTFRKAGTGMLTLNGNSSYANLTTIEGGTLKLGHANALGASGTAASYTTMSAGTLDLNGITTPETLNVTGNSTLANSSGIAGGLSADANLTANLIVDATGDISATRMIGTGAIRTITKNGVGTLTTGGTSHNNLSSWVINNGAAVFANTSGYGADRGVTIAGGTLKLSGANSDLINDGQSFTLNSGVFDLNGKAEAVASIGGTGGFVRNTAAGSGTLYVGGGVAGTSSASFAGVIENGTGTLNVTKEGSGTQTLTGANTYTGNTTISAGALALSGTGSIASTARITVAAGATFDVSGLSSTFVLGAGQTLAGAGATGTLKGNLNATSGALSLTYVGTPTLTMTSGTLTLNNNGCTVTTGSALAAGSYKLISAGSGGVVAGAVATSSVTMAGAGIASGTVASLKITGGELYLVVTHPPVAANLTLGVGQGDTATLKIIGGKSSPTDSDNDSLTVSGAVLNTPANGGAVSVVGGTDVSYTAAASFSGTDTFNYTVSDGNGGTATATVTVTVAPAGTGANITSISGSSPTMTVQALGIPSVTYQLQYTTNITAVNWQDVSGAGAAATANAATGALTLTDVNATNSQAWYRTRYVSGP